MSITSEALRIRAFRFVEEAAEAHTRQEAADHVFALLQELIGFDTGIVVSLEDPRG